jgi:hypothetical protein
MKTLKISALVIAIAAILFASYYVQANANRITVESAVAAK